MKRTALMLMAALTVSVMMITGCNQPVESTARDGIAAASGFLQREVTNNADSCQAQPSQQKCVTIKKAAQSLAVAIDALEAYCSGPGFNAGTTPCQAPASGNVKSALAQKLSAALSDLNRDISDVKKLVAPNQAGIDGMALLSLIGLILPILKGFISSATKSNAPQEVIDALQGAVTALENVHNTAVTRAQLEGLKVEVPW